jgi:hypothetical protein
MIHLIKIIGFVIKINFIKKVGLIIKVDFIRLILFKRLD